MRLQARMIPTTAAEALLLLAILLGFGESSAKVQAQEPQDGVPKFETFLGYSYLRAVPTLADGNRMVWLNGGSVSVAFNFNDYLGLVGDFGGFTDSELRLTGSGANPPRVANSSGTAFTYLGGPRLSYRRHERFVPFAQALFGAVHASEVTLSGCTGANCTLLPTENAFAMTAGGGLDLTLSRRLAIRLIQAEYLMTRFADLTTGDRQTQNDIRLSAGLVFRLGGGPPPLPVTYTCAASPASGYPGDTLTVTGVALNLDPKSSAVYTWASDGGKVSGSTATANIDTTGVAPGSYTARGHVSEGTKPGHFADCSAGYTIMGFQPPTVTCSATPSSVPPGEPSAVTAQATSPQNRPLTYSYSASAGAISGSTSNATLSTSGVIPGTITVTCNATDDKGQSASATTTVAVQAPVPQPAPATQNLCSASFGRDAKRPARVDNEAKACLDEVALSLQRFPNSRLAVVGNSGALQPAFNTRDYLVGTKSVDTSRITVYAGTGDSSSVDMIMVPAGATLDMTGVSPVDESRKR